MPVTKKKRTKKNKQSIGLDIFHWVGETLKNGVELFEEFQMIPDPDSGATVRRDTRKLREICIGIIGTDNARDWYRVCRCAAPPGVILEDFNEKRWENTYEDTLALVRVALTKALLLERDQRSARTLLDVLERRDSERWAKKDTGRKVEVTAPVDKEGAKEFKVAFVGI